jgi:hypothetical protein
MCDTYRYIPELRRFCSSQETPTQDTEPYYTGFAPRSTSRSRREQFFLTKTKISPKYGIYRNKTIPRLILLYYLLKGLQRERFSFGPSFLFEDDPPWRHLEKVKTALFHG